MENIAQINIYRDEQFGSPARYSWSVKTLGCYGDESAGCPAGSGLHTIAGAMQQALVAAIEGEFAGARIEYKGADGVWHSLDTAINVGPVTIERARRAADALMEARG